MNKESFLKILFPVSILLAPLYLGAVHLWSFSISIFIATVSFYFYFFRLQKSSHALVIHTRLDAVIALYLLFFIMSSAKTQIPYKTAVEAFKTLSIFCVFSATLYYCRERQNIRSLATAITLFGGAVSFFGLLQWLGALPKPWWDNPHFLSSVYVNHNHFAGLLEVILPISIGLILGEESSSKKILLIFLSGLMGFAFILSLSRGGFLSMALALGFMLFLLTMKKAVRKVFWVLMALVLVVLAASALFGLGPLLSRLETMKDLGSAGGDVSIQQRYLIWKGALDLISKNLWFGTGPGTFETTFFKFRPYGFIERPGFAHNDYLQLLADCGVFVFLTAMGFFMMLFYKGLRIIRKHQSILSLGIASGCLASIVAWAAHSLVDFNFHIPANWIFFAVASGMLLSVGRPKGYSSPVLQMAMSGFITATCALVLMGCVFFGISDWFLWKGKREYKMGQFKTSATYFDRSIRINSFNAEPYYLRALISESQDKAKKDLLQAIHLNPLEPYYEYALAKVLLKSSDSENIAKALPYFQKVIQKDPRDPRLQYLSAQDLLLANHLRDKEAEREVKVMLRTCVELDPSSAFLIYRLLWNYENKIEMLEDFNKAAPKGLQGFVEFLTKENLWKYYRKYYLNSLGIDADEKYRLGTSFRWRDKPSESYSLKDFEAIGPNAFFLGDFIYTNGRFEKKFSLLSPTTRFKLRAKGSKAGNSYPILLVWLDGKVVDSLYIDSPEFIDFFSILRASPGGHVLGIEFINDYMGDSPKRDRNVWIKAIELHDSAAAEQK